MRGWFAYELLVHMMKNDNIYLLTGDLGYGVFDIIRDNFPDRFINCGAAEQAMMGIAVGLALEGKIPFVYSITTFLLYRPFETIRNYVNHEQIPVRLIGSGRDRDYEHDGFSHWSEDAFGILSDFPDIQVHWPIKKEAIPGIVKEMIETNKPAFLSLRR